MAKRKRKTLPKDFEDLLKNGDEAAIISALENCEADAYGGRGNNVGLAFSELPDGVARWLIEQGANISAGNHYGETPLHIRSRHWKCNIDVLLELGADVNSTDNKGSTPLHVAASSGHAKTVQLLLEHGADPKNRNKAGYTPLEYALRQCSTTLLPKAPGVAELLLEPKEPQPSGLRGFASRMLGRSQTDDDRISPKMKEAVTRLGTEFEFRRSDFNPEIVDETSAALDRLYDLFEVPPVPRRKTYDGTSPIVASADTWNKRHQELWELLVPSQGAASTVQGEVIRLSGRIAREVDDNGGVNWDSDFNKMADALLKHLGTGEPLPTEALEEASGVIGQAKRKQGDPVRLMELAVDWVALNPNPIALDPPAYKR